MPHVILEAIGMAKKGSILPRGSMYAIIRYLGFGYLGIMVQVLGKYMIIRYLDP